MMNQMSLTNRAVFEAPTDRVELSPLTLRQQDVFTAISEYCRVTGEPCTANYLARRLGLHHSTVHEHLAALHRKGWLRAPNAPAMPRRDWLR